MILIISYNKGYTTDGSSRRPSYRPAGSASTHT